MSNILANEYYNSKIGEPKQFFKVMRDKYTNDKFKFALLADFFLTPKQKRKSRLKRLVKYLIFEEKFKPKFMFTFTFNDNHIVPIEQVGKEIGKFWNRINSLSTQGYVDCGKRIGAIHLGKKTGRVHWHDLTDTLMPEAESVLDFWEGRIWFQNLYSKNNVTDILAKHFKIPSNSNDFSSANIFSRSKMLEMIRRNKCFNTFLTLINNECKTEESMLGQLKPFLIHLKRIYGENIKYFVRIFKSNKYNCYSAYLLTSVKIKDAYYMCQAWKNGFLSIEYLREPEKGLQYSFGYVFKNFPARLKYGQGYSWSRGLEHPPKKWRYVEEIAEGLTEDQANEVIQEGDLALEKIELEREQKMNVQLKQNKLYLEKLRRKQETEEIKEIVPEERVPIYEKVGHITKQGLLNFIKQSRHKGYECTVNYYRIYNCYWKSPTSYIDKYLCELLKEGCIKEPYNNIYKYIKDFEIIDTNVYSLKELYAFIGIEWDYKKEYI